MMIIDLQNRDNEKLEDVLRKIEQEVEKLSSCVRQKHIEDPTMSEQRRNMNTICVCTHEAGFCHEVTLFVL